MYVNMQIGKIMHLSFSDAFRNKRFTVTRCLSIVFDQ